MIYIIVAIFCVSASMSFAYLIRIGHNNSTSGEVITSTFGNAKLEVEGMLSFSDTDILPGHKEISSVKVVATGNNENILYNLVWIGKNELSAVNFTVYSPEDKVEGLSTNCENIKDTLENGLPSFYEECTVNNIARLGTPVASGQIRAGQSSALLVSNNAINASSSGTTKYFYIILEYPNLDESQNNDAGKTFEGKIYAEEINETNSYVYNSVLVSQDINYDETLDTITNPDRGFYYPVVISGTSDGFNASVVAAEATNAKNNNSSLLQLKFDLSKLSGRANGDTDKDFTTKDLEDINAAFDIVRQNNLKAIVRFAYTWNDLDNKEPASFSKILEHVAQLQPVFETNKDVITVVEAGFIGKWGEMHTSDYANTQCYNALINALLNAVPKSLTINVRTPIMYTSRFSNKVITQSVAYNKSYESRVGIFNDGYLGSETDLGTYSNYINREAALQWMQSQTKYTIFGGEVTIPESTYNDIDYAQNEMFITHTTYLNYLWNDYITHTKWVQQIYNGSNKVYKGSTAFKYINDHLGYRFVLRNSQIIDEVEQGEKLPLSLLIENTGFGNVVNKKNVEIILSKGSKYYVTNVNLDARNWDSNTLTNQNLVLRVPSDIELGKWDLYLKVSDEFNSDYTIKFANHDIYDNYFKANYIGEINITCNDENNGEYSFGQEFANENETPNIFEIAKDMVVDGRITSRAEWEESDIFYQTALNYFKLYLYADETYLYLYTKDDNTTNNLVSYIQLKFANGDSASNEDYKFSIENENLYSGNLFVNSTTLMKTVSRAFATGYEYKILLSDLNIQSVSDLKQVHIRFMDSSWQTLSDYTYTYSPYKVLEGKTVLASTDCNGGAFTITKYEGNYYLLNGTLTTGLYYSSLETSNFKFVMNFGQYGAPLYSAALASNPPYLQNHTYKFKYTPIASTPSQIYQVAFLFRNTDQNVGGINGGGKLATIELEGSKLFSITEPAESDEEPLSVDAAMHSMFMELKETYTFDNWLFKLDLNEVK